MPGRFCIALLLCALISGCSSSASPDDSPALPDSYGNPPRPTTTTANGALLANNPNFCAQQGGQTLSWTDALGELRDACLIRPPSASSAKPLPLLVWLHASLSPPGSITATNILEQIATANLSNDPARPGFVLLLPSGRDIEHFYPVPDQAGIGWDNWYRNLDRSSPTLNVDVASLDHFIAAAKATGVVDSHRVYLSGWSNGAAMSILYSLNTAGIAAAAVYSAPGPYSGGTDPNPQTPFATRLTPLYAIHNACDIGGNCYGGAALSTALTQRYPSLLQRHVILDNTQTREVDVCDSACQSPTALATLTTGTRLHLLWPDAFTDELFTFLREHPLP